MHQPDFMFCIYLLALSFPSFVASSAIPSLAHRSTVANIPLTPNINPHIDFKGILRGDQSRAADLISKIKQTVGNGPHLRRQTTSVAVQNTFVTYTANVNVGSPATTYKLLIDTGSSNTWVGATKPYSQTGTSHNTGQTVAVTYGSGSFSGTEFLDQVDLGNGLVTDQSIGVANKSQGLSDLDGILGIGPVGLTLGTLSPASDEKIPTVTDNLFSQGIIPANEIGIYYSPSNLKENGELTFGGTDRTKYVGGISYAPITGSIPASNFWGVDQGITYGLPVPGLDHVITSGAPGIVDTGTTLFLLATDYFQQYQKLTGAVFDQATGLLRVTEAQYLEMRTLYLRLGSNTFEFTPNAQIWPRTLNTMVGGKADAIYLIVADLGKPSGSGLDFINGYSFLQRFYTVYDTANERVGFAQTAHTLSVSN